MGIETLKAVYATLNTIEVKGKDNLNSLLGCINALGSYIQVQELAQQNQEGSNG